MRYFRAKFNIESDNFDLYFEKQLSTITEAGRDAIPKDIILFNTDGSVRRKTIKSLDYQAKLWILWKCLKKRIWTVVENEETGLNLEEFLELKEAIKKRDLGVKKADGISAKSTFVTGDKDLCEMFNYLRQLSSSPAYNYLNKYKNFKPTKTSEQAREMKYIVRFIRNYEVQKKKWNIEKSISMPEWYVLIYLYDKDYGLGSAMYKETYLRVYHSSSRRIKQAFGSLQSRGLILKHGDKKGTRFQITPMGTDLVNYILSTYILNC